MELCRLLILQDLPLGGQDTWPYLVLLGCGHLPYTNIHKYYYVFGIVHTFVMCIMLSGALVMLQISCCAIFILSDNFTCVIWFMISFVVSSVVLYFPMFCFNALFIQLCDQVACMTCGNMKNPEKTTRSI